MTVYMPEGLPPQGRPPPVTGMLPFGGRREKAPRKKGAGGIATNPIDPNNNLRGQQIGPARSAGVQKARGLGIQALDGIFNAPDRGQLASQTFGLIQEQTRPQFEQDLRTVGQRAASLGRIGAGMTTNELTDVFTTRERDLDQLRRGLSLDAAGQTLSDRLNQFGAATGAEGFFAGQDRADRDELRGERGYQNDLRQQGIQNFIQQKTLEEMLLGGQFGREQARLNTLLGYGYGSSPSGAMNQQAAHYGQQAGNAFGSSSGLLSVLPFLMQGQGTPGTLPAPTTGPTSYVPDNAVPY